MQNDESPSSSSGRRPKITTLEHSIPWHCLYRHNLEPRDNFRPLFLGSENVLTHCPTLFTFGGFLSSGNHDDKIWILKLFPRSERKIHDGGELIWEEIQVFDDKIPYAREFPCLSYDMKHQLIYLFGGFGNEGHLNDLWTFDLKVKKWSNIETKCTPPSPRCGCCGIYSPSRDKFYVFGGYNGSYFKDFYELDLLETKEWKMIDSPHTIPTLTVITLNTAVSDNCLTIFGGYDGQQYVSGLHHFDFNTREWKSTFTEIIQPNELLAHSRCITLRGSHKHEPKSNNFIFLFHDKGVGSEIYEFDEEELQLIKYTIPENLVENFSVLDGKFICEFDNNTLLILGQTELCFIEIRKLKYDTKNVDYFFHNLKKRTRNFTDLVIL